MEYQASPCSESREEKLAKRGMKAVFPLWHRDTNELVRTFVALGFKAVLACLDGKLGEKFAGRPLDLRFLHDLPADVDPCGENGEYHSFVYDGPLFQEPVSVKVSAVVFREGRYFADLLPDLRDAGHRSVLVAPIQFLADHLEVLYDIDIGAKAQADEAGMAFARIESLNGNRNWPSSSKRQKSGTAEASLERGTHALRRRLRR